MSNPEYNLIESYDLYNGKPPHQSESDTSEAAAEAIRWNVDTLRYKVFDFIRGRGKEGATDQEVQEALNLEMSTEIPRRRELVLKGYVLDSGYRRKTRAGREAAIWIVSGTVDASELGPARSPKIKLLEAEAEIGRLKTELKDEQAASRKASRFYIKENKALKERIARLEVSLEQAVKAMELKSE